MAGRGLSEGADVAPAAVLADELAVLVLHVGAAAVGAVGAELDGSGRLQQPATGAADDLQPRPPVLGIELQAARAGAGVPGLQQVRLVADGEAAYRERISSSAVGATSPR
jgi:hypothetical protein